MAKHILGGTKWGPAKWDRGEINAGLAKQATLKAKAAAADQATTEALHADRRHQGQGSAKDQVKAFGQHP